MRALAGVHLTDWRDQVFAVLKAAEILQVGYVPDAGHARLIELCRDDPDMRAVPLTTEEEGVALATGAWLGGQRAALLMGSKTQAALELCDVLVYRVERPEEAAEIVTAALDIAYNGDLATAVLLAQRLIGAKRWVK